VAVETARRPVIITHHIDSTKDLAQKVMISPLIRHTRLHFGIERASGEHERVATRQERSAIRHCRRVLDSADVLASDNDEQCVEQQRGDPAVLSDGQG
jgi:hypothetical protein